MTRHSEARTLRKRKESAIRRALLVFYDGKRRDLPWRGTGDPYAVLVSEVMLQQTRVGTVLRYYDAWMRRFPDVAALARAPESDVLHAWQGLGYYSRARRLHGTARAVMERHGGRLPDDPALLLALPGLGAYSAGAIASIAFGRREPIVDGNVVRVLTRLFGLRGDPSKAPLKRELWRLARELVPLSRPGDFNQALMELGATICTPRSADCALCPLSTNCRARALGIVNELPELPARARPTPIEAAALIVRERERVLVVRRRADAPRWGGLWTFPQVERAAGENAADAARRAASEQTGLAVTPGKTLAVVVHTITRYRIRLEAIEGSLGSRHGKTTARRAPGRRNGDGNLDGDDAVRWVSAQGLEELAMPAPHRKLARRLFATEPGS